MDNTTQRLEIIEWILELSIGVVIYSELQRLATKLEYNVGIENYEECSKVMKSLDSFKTTHSELLAPEMDVSPEELEDALHFVFDSIRNKLYTAE
jgi:hypothetical protein